MTDPVSDMLIRIKNAQAVAKEQVLIPHSRVLLRIAEILKEGGFIQNVGCKKKKIGEIEHEMLCVTLKYNDGEGAIDDIRILSRPSRRMYIKASGIKPIRSGYGLAVVSTSKGIMSSMEAKKNKLGGELMFEVW